MQEVVVRSFYGIKARMALCVYRNDVEHSDVMRQQFVEPEQEIKFPFLLNIHVEEKLAGMYVRICTAATVDGDRCFECLTQELFQHPLYVCYAWLFLPAAIV